MNKNIFLFLLSFSFLAIGITFAQNEKIVKITNKSERIEIIGGKKYFLHIVLQGQTLYSIAKAYEVSVDDIVASNPDIKAKPISPEQILKIPVKAQVAPVVSQKQDIAGSNDLILKKDSFIFHTVRGKETLYGIAKKYNCSEVDIRNANPDQDMNLKIGQIIKIPFNPDFARDKKKGFLQGVFKKSHEADTRKDSASSRLTKTDSAAVILKTKIDKDIAPAPAIPSSFNLALFLPLNLNEVESIQTDESDESEIKPPSVYKSMSYLQYYEGILLALDSLKHSGLNARLFVYDISDSMQLSNLQNNNAFNNITLLFCPFLNNSMSLIVNNARNNNINILTYSPNNSLLKNYDKHFSLYPSEASQAKQLAEFILDKFMADNVIIVFEGNNNKEKKCSDSFKKELNEIISSGNSKFKSYKEVDLSKENIYSIKEKLSPSKNNILISFLRDEVIVSDYVRFLNSIRDSRKIILFGSQNWENFQNVEKDYLENLNLHLFSTNFIDYSDDAVIKFINKFRYAYKTEPNLLAFLGYDAAFYFSDAFLKYGNKFQNHLLNIKSDLLSNKFLLQKSDNNGYENIYMNIYKYHDYKLVNARE